MVKKIQLFIFLGILFCFLNTTCFAYMSSDYLDYGLETLKDTYTTSNSSDMNRRRTFVGALYNDSTAKALLLNNFNNQLDTWGIPDVTDRNIIGFLHWASNNAVVLKFFVCNNSVPAQYNQLDFFLFNNNKISAYSNSTEDFIYQFNCNINLSNNVVSLSNFGSYILPTNGTSSLEINSPTFTTDTNTVLTGYNYFCCGLPAGFAYYPLTSTNSSNIIPIILQDANGNYQIPSPNPTPSGDNNSSSGTITNPSGDVTGNIDLSGIENSLNDINTSVNTQGENIINQISGDTQKIINSLTGTTTNITSGDTKNQFEDMLSSTANVVDPTTNFFSWLIDNIRSVLNSTGNYNITITLFNETYTIRSDFFTLPDGDLKTFLQMSFIAWFGWRIIKKIRYIVYAIQCVNISSALDNADFNADIL